MQAYVGTCECDHMPFIGRPAFYQKHGNFKRFESYLNTKTKKVKIGSAFSVEEPITCVIPQGSILGPIIILLYINNLKNSFKFLFIWRCSNILLIGKSIDGIEKSYNSELKHVTKWLNVNKLFLNIDFLKLEFTPYKAEQPLQGMELQEKETQKD